MKIINRYLISELFVPTFWSLFVLTFVLLLSEVLNMAELLFERNVEFSTILKIIGSSLLYLTGLSIPLAFLFGILMCFGRLTGENEIIALKTSGISNFRIAIPVFYFTMFLFCVSFFLHVSVLPRANWAVEQSLHNLAQNAASLLEEKVWLDYFGNSSIYVEKIYKGDKLHNITINQPIENFDIPRVISAVNGEYTLEKTTSTVNLTLFDGHIDEPSQNRDDTYLRIDFKKYNISFPINKREFSKTQKKMEHFTFWELEHKIKNTPKDRKDYKWLLYEKNNRMAISFACIVFFLIGFPLSLHFKKAEKSSNLLIGVILVLSWYILMLTGRGLTLGGHIPVELGSWLPNIVIGIAGVILNLRMASQ